MKKHSNTPIKPSNSEIDLVRTLDDQQESANADKYADDRQQYDHEDHEGAAIERAERLLGC